MTKAKKYRVLIVDDKLNVLENAKELIRPEFNLLNERWNIEIETLHVKVNGDDTEEKYFIEEQTFLNLGKVSDKPFDLLLLDFGFRKPDSDIFEKIKKRYGDNFGFSELEGFIFNPRNLVEEGLKVLNRKHLKKGFLAFQNNFVNHKGTIFIYTFIPEKWRKYVQNSTLRENITKRTFPNAKSIELIDTRKEIFNDTEFESLKSERYYSFIISKFLEQVVQLEIAKESISKAKYIKVQRTSKVIGLIVLFGAFIGASSEFFGDLIVGFFKSNQIIVGIVFVLFTLLLILFGGKLLVYLLEKGLKKLLSDE